jgi:hypothetical protein
VINAAYGSKLVENVGFRLWSWLSNKTKIEARQEEDEMDDGAATADLRRLDKTCAQQRHRNIGEIEYEERPARNLRKSMLRQAK